MLEDAHELLLKIQTGLGAKAQTLDLDSRRAHLAELETQSNAPDLWDDPASAQVLMQKMSAARETIAPFDSIANRAIELLELTELAQGENDAALAAEIERDTKVLQNDYDALERLMLFGGEYDANNAIVSINAGAGGTEAQDWAQMLVRAYIRWAQLNNFSLEVLEESPGEEAGLKGFQAIFSGTNAYGHLKAEAGVHRLVRISPFNSAASA